MLKKFFVLCLSFFLISSVNSVWAGETSDLPEGLQNFNKSVVYEQGEYRDVDEDAWYGDHHEGCIKEVTELGIMQGDGDGTFRPEESLSLGEIVKIAVVLHCIYYGEPIPENATNGDPWYQNYVDYALDKGILEKADREKVFAYNRGRSYKEYVNRQEMARLIYKALPLEALEKINMIKSLPMGESILDDWYHPIDCDFRAISDLYKAGILTGDPDTHVYKPAHVLKRAEAAAVIARTALPQNRLHFSVSDHYLKSIRERFGFYNPDNGKYLDSSWDTKEYSRSEIEEFTGQSDYADIITYYETDYDSVTQKETHSVDVRRVFEFGEISVSYYEDRPEDVTVWGMDITSPYGRMWNGLTVGSSQSDVIDTMKNEPCRAKYVGAWYDYRYYDPQTDRMIIYNPCFEMDENGKVQRICLGMYRTENPYPDGLGDKK